MAKEENPYRPCENSACGAIDSTHCVFDHPLGQVVSSQQDEAKAVGCRVVRFLKEGDSNDGA